MVFTQEDAQDDAKIKKETRSDLGRVASERSPRIWQHFVNVCDNMNQDPKDVLADMLVRALNNQEYADSISDTEVTMEAISRGDYRKEDIQLVKELSQEFGLEPQENKSIVDKIIEDRIESKATPPWKRAGNEDGGGGSRDLERRLERLEQQNRQLQQELEDERDSDAEESENDYGGTSASPSDGRKDIDELFGEEKDDDEEEDVIVEVEDGPNDDGDGVPEIEVENSAGDVEAEEEDML